MGSEMCIRDSIGTDQEPVHTYLYAGTYDVSLVVTSPIGCQESEFYPALIRVDSVPAVSFLPNDGTCLDGAVDFVDMTPSNGGDIISWSWDFGDGNTSTEQNPMHEYAVSDTYDVSLTVEAENGCSNTIINSINCLLYTSPSPRDLSTSRMPSSA